MHWMISRKRCNFAQERRKSALSATSKYPDEFEELCIVFVSKIFLGGDAHLENVEAAAKP